MVKSIFSLRKVLYGVIVIIFVIISYNIIVNIISLWQRQYVIDQAKTELSRVREENLSLKSQLENVSRPGFIEEEARNKLFYVKPGEQIVYMPQKKEEYKEVEVVRLSPFKEWLALFF